ncbi:class I SAM-dependent methyltransferase [Fulvivirgaceae bacterium PWU4]|uniref:Class I SAM-dependent methyltransferase n=1 Tax=Chryseosolibacter histidini TaxID=2782349 RepID=A0AAP2DH32_9BACT|nr:TylF/MycF/NovP-related O-methyltransferase [Chryseosolibacter histidini]MBT1695479.1 class I SAM-dependent methyltransferase [Chryseosolibacter histidini]
MEHTTFILKYLRKRELTRAQRFFHPLIKKFNDLDLNIRIYYKNDELNRKLSIRKPQYENLLIGDCTSIEKMMNIYFLLQQTLRLNIEGDVVELGCYRGTSAAVIREMLNQFSSNKRFHVYDSFQGLPDESSFDGPSRLLKKGQLKTSKDNLIGLFRSRGLELPEIHEGWFNETLPTQLPEKIAFAHLDGDFYDSIMDSLVNVYPRLSPGAVAVIDDFCDPSVLDIHNILPGVKKACDDFFADKPEKVQVLLCGGQSQAYFIKK